jgi:DNA-binding beta-propeller fold protein YncE
MFATQWGFSGATAIKQFNFVTGAPSGPDIAVPFIPQEIAMGPDGALYASALYDSPVYEGVYRYDGSVWNVFADTVPLSGTGPHGFAFDPINDDLYLAMQTGEILRFDGNTGDFLNQANFVPTKLTDILFHEIPAPGALVTLALGGAAAWRRRR